MSPSFLPFCASQPLLTVPRPPLPTLPSLGSTAGCCYQSGMGAGVVRRVCGGQARYRCAGGGIAAGGLQLCDSLPFFVTCSCLHVTTHFYFSLNLSEIIQWFQSPIALPFSLFKAFLFYGPPPISVICPENSVNCCHVLISGSDQDCMNTIASSFSVSMKSVGRYGRTFL